MVMLLPSKSTSPPNPKLSTGKRNPLSMNPLSMNPLSMNPLPTGTNPCSFATLPVLDTCWTGAQRLTLSPVFLMVVVGLAAPLVILLSENSWFGPKVPNGDVTNWSGKNPLLGQTRFPLASKKQPTG